MGCREALLLTKARLRASFQHFVVENSHFSVARRDPTAAEKATGINWVVSVGCAEADGLDLALSYTEGDTAAMEAVKRVVDFIRDEFDLKDVPL